MKPGLVALFAASAMSFLGFGQAAQQTPEEIIKMLGAKGVYLDTVTATPRFVALKGTRVSDVRVEKRSGSQPVWVQIKGEGATVRTTALQPVFYVYGERPEQIGLFVLSVKANAREMQSGAVRFEGNRQQGTTLKNDFIKVDVQTLAPDLVRITPAGQLSGGEYAFGRPSVFLEIGMQLKTKQPIFDFGVDVR